jgi:hypothetical protein
MKGGLPTVAQVRQWRVHLRLAQNLGQATADNLRLIMERRLVDQNSASWNQLLPWLRRVDTLRGGQIC